MAFIPITVVTGFLGAGKTSIILSLLPQLPPGYKAVLLKNEFGDIEVDSKLAQQSSLTAVSEILNGCMCCVLIGQMQTAILEIKDNYRPDRIIIECSGSAFPASLAFQIREIERQTLGELRLDAIVTVIDAENFTGYEDTSPTAKMQSSYTDIILINKWEHVTERQLEDVMDHLHTLNDTTPMLKCQAQGGVDPKLIFGLETKLFMDANEGGCHEEGPAHHQHPHHDEVETISLGSDADGEGLGISKDTLDRALNALSKESIWRVKGFIRLEAVEDVHILNWAFGRYLLTPMTDGEEKPAAAIRLTVMGARGEVRRAIRKFAAAIDAHVNI